MQISPAEFEPKWFSSVQILGKSSSNGLCLKAGAGRTGNLSNFPQWRQTLSLTYFRAARQLV
ncbi:hypothetical protein FD01_GL002438 [Lacticaseibacillus manihotivorans DSM 13343 = JCM 12514]|uniref:Uncharacterized protein n=1 Tax=Lacticaseibacillus manihotivorans DSM 13343 = JCM 12514 TaxID=1423769 RepID=A0A0R1RDX4_9LACO|nr:hypothetical protein FD01_GL002438 [Lacticaseibacillus manihotivorans DSM 13343 = JCM 12514]